MSKLRKVNNIAKKNGIKEEIFESTRKDKKYMVRYNNTLIHFGQIGYEDFIDHNDCLRRDRYLKRASRIRNGNGKLTYKNKNYANFWSIHILW